MTQPKTNGLIEARRRLSEAQAEVDRRIEAAIDLVARDMKPYGASRAMIVMKLRWGRVPHTLEEVGDLLGVTRERVRQIENQVLRRVTEEEERNDATG